MSTSSILVLVLILLILIFLMLISLMLRIRRLEEKSADVSTADIATYVSNMREILIESERAAERLDAGIKEKEAMLEDLSDLVENRLNRLQQLSGGSASGSHANQPRNIPPGSGQLQSAIYQMLLKGDTVPSIARKLSITPEQVEMLINLVD